jgi:ankyrin repeat protein
MKFGSSKTNRSIKLNAVSISALPQGGAASASKLAASTEVQTLYLKGSQAKRWQRKGSSMNETQVEEEMSAAIAGLPSDLRKRAEQYPFPQLHNACLDADLELIEAMLDAGLAADMYPCTEDEDDVPPLTWIAAYRDGEIGPTAATVDLLLRRGASIDEGFPLLAAAERGDIELVQIFLGAGADVGLALQEKPDADVVTLIHEAVNEMKKSALLKPNLPV